MALPEDLVLAVLSLSLLVRIVRRCLFDGLEEILFEVELADMGDGATLNGIIWELGGAVVDDGCLTS